MPLAFSRDSACDEGYANIGSRKRTPSARLGNLHKSQIGRQEGDWHTPTAPKAPPQQVGHTCKC